MVVPLFLIGIFAADPCIHHAHAVVALDRLANARSDGVVVEELALDVQGSVVPARLYRPDAGHARSIPWSLASGSSRHPPGIVLCHGIHRLGIDEPRLQRFARALAGTGITVLTPRIAALTDYRIDAASVPTIDVASRALAARLNRARVGVMGFSFAGGLSLVAASRPEASPAIGMVVAIGAHDDLARVTRFFAEGSTPSPHGVPLVMHPHEYGPLVFAYGYPERFFEGPDVAIAKEAMRLRLWEKHGEADELAKSLSAEGAKRWAELVGGDRASLGPLLETLTRENAAAFDAASPHGKLGNLHVPVYLLHGSGDSVIPPTETEWLATEVPARELRGSLVSPVIQHVELSGEPTVRDRFAIVHFLSNVIRDLDEL